MRYLKLSIRPNPKGFQFRLRYTPTEPNKPEKFTLPLSIFEWAPHVDGLVRKVFAVGEKPKFFLEPTVVNFKTKVIAKGQKPLPFH